MAIFKPETNYVATVALPAAGAFLDSPIINAAKGYELWCFFVQYVSGAIGGAPSFRVEAQGNGGTLYLATNAFSPTQLAFEEMQGPLAAGAVETMAYEVYVRNKGGVDAFRLNVRESGVPGTPGTIRVRFVAGTYAG